MALPRRQTKEYLDSDRLNFLIWRYLLEGNYRETAAKFQKEWHVPAPHRQFAFASHVENQALVQVVQRGLLYHAFQRQYAQQAQKSITEGDEAPQVGIFGPLDSLVAQQDDQEDAEGEPDEGEPSETDHDGSRKRTVDRRNSQLLNGSPAAKRPRLSNGCENGVDTVSGVGAGAGVPGGAAAAAAAAAVTATGPTSTAMDLDDHQNHHYHHHNHAETNNHNHINNNAYPSPLECEQPPPILHTQGPDKGTQLDKVEELSTATTFLQLTPNDEPDSTSPLRAGGEHAPVLLHCEWNPKDPSSLAAAGTDSLARIWTVARNATSSGPDHVHDHVNGDGPSPSFRSLIPDLTPANAVVTGLAWNSDGSAIAVAVNNNDISASISIWSATGEYMQQLNINEPPVIQLRWNPNNIGLLAVAPDNGSTAVTVYSGDRQLVHVLPDALDHELDAAWTSETEFLLCSRDVFLALRCTPTAIEVIHKFETRPDDSFTRVLYDQRSKVAATISNGGTLDLWDETGQRRSIAAHSGQVTAIQWQPLQCSPTDNERNERLIATASDDNTIAIWNIWSPEPQARCRLHMNSQVLAISFTPDGAFLAGATADDVLIWKVGDYFMPRASWTRPPHPGWLSPPKANGDLEEEEDAHTLCWDASGQKLAYGANSRLAVIRFR